MYECVYVDTETERQKETERAYVWDSMHERVS